MKRRATNAASSAERRIALGLVALFVLATAIVMPVATRRFVDGRTFIGEIAAASVVAMLTTAAILRFRYRLAHHAPLAYLALTFAYGGFAALLYGASDPMIAWTWLVWHFGFVAFLGVAIRAERTAPTKPTRGERHRVRRYVIWSAIAGLCIALAVRLAEAQLPALVDRGSYTSIFRALVAALVLLPSAVLAIELTGRTKLRRAEDLWIAAVLALTFCEALAGAELAGKPYSLGWYVGRIEGVAATLIFLAVQLRLIFERLRHVASQNRELAEVAQHDALTGLLNRRAFDERFETMWRQCRRVREPLSLVILDVDHFKRYNDHFGHIAGDGVLRRIGEELTRAAKRPSDSACRIGGEEFALILPFTDATGANVVAERVVLRIRELVIPHAPGLPTNVVTASVGVATAPLPTNARRTLHEQADAALYHAKRSGRDRVGTAQVGSRVSVRVG